MSAILFGSIGTIADTSKLQRQSFNKAFKHHGLDWYWSPEQYLELLKQNGGKQRIEDYGTSIGKHVDAEAIHQSKSQIFQSLLQQERIVPREGVLETIAKAKENKIKLAFVTTTSQENIDSLLTALGDRIDPQVFTVIINAAEVEQTKPAKDAYVLALQKLNENKDNCVAIEDNLGGVRAARDAGISCIAFPNQNTARHDFSTANLQIDLLEFAELSKFILAQNYVR